MSQVKKAKIGLIQEAIKISGTEGTDKAVKLFDKLYDMPNYLIIKTIKLLKEKENV